MVEKIRAELERHRRASGLLSKPIGEYGIWAQTLDEMKKVADLLLERHVASPARQASLMPSKPPLTSAPPKLPTRAPMSPAAHLKPEPAKVARSTPSKRESRPPQSGVRCRHCGGGELEARWGKFGYHWNCAACGKNTPMPTVCSGCGKVGKHGRDVRIQKRGPEFIRVCDPCGRQEEIWRQIQTP